MPHTDNPWNEAPPLDAVRAREHGARIEHGMLRRSMLEGKWQFVADRGVQKMAGVESAESWPPSDISKCLFKDVIEQVSVLFDGEAVVSHDAADAAEYMRETLVKPANLWGVLAENQRQTNALREGFVRIEVVEIDGVRRLSYRAVPGDRIIAVGHPNAPGTPVYVEEYRARFGGWTRDVLDVSDPLNPRYYVEALDIEDGSGHDITEMVLGPGPWSGAAYPFRYSDGRAFIPGVLYHARSGKWRTFDYTWGIELVEATVRCVAYWTFWGHNVMDASWPIPWALDAEPQGGVKTNANGRAIVDLDPGCVMLFKSKGDKNGSLGNFPPGSDPSSLGESIRAYAADAVSGYGINPADAQRVSADPRSGYAISLSRNTVREQQDKQIPIFLPFDRELLNKSAAIWNRLGGANTTLPETGWNLGYTGLPLTSQERADELDRWVKEADQGVSSKVDLTMRLQRLSRPQAIEVMERVNAENAKFGIPGAEPTTPQTPQTPRTP